MKTLILYSSMGFPKEIIAPTSSATGIEIKNQIISAMMYSIIIPCRLISIITITQNSIFVKI